MAKPNGAAVETAAIPLKPDFSDRDDVFERVMACAHDPNSFGIAEVPVEVSIRFERPRKQDWVRCHPDRDRTIGFDCLKDDKSGKLYIVTPAIRSLIATQARTYHVRQAVTYDRVSYLWPVPVDPPSEINLAHLNAQQLALSQWVRLEWDGKTYKAYNPQGELGDPEWPPSTFKELLALQ
jgi:hypothetical protein